jgi:DNA (cytosine-5)-methyltransferase 1
VEQNNNGSVETFVLSKDGRTIYRIVSTRRRKKIRTAVKLNQAIPNGSNDRLASLADQSFICSQRRPRAKQRGRFVTVTDLFSGCGAMSVGVQEACRALGYRFKPVLSIDLDENASTVYKANFPKANVYAADIRTIFRGRLRARLNAAEKKLKKRVGHVDIAVAGPPCQGHSDLNNHTRRQDPKNGLYYRIVRFAKIIKPTHLIIENVPAVVHDRGRVLSRARKALQSLKYHIVLDDFINMKEIGVPQNRRRHVLVASLKRSRELKDILMTYRRRKRSVNWAIQDLLAVRSDSVMDREPGQTKRASRRIRYLFKNRAYNLPNRLRPSCHRSNNHTYNSVYGRLWWGKPAQTITTGFMCMGQGRFVHPKKGRTLTAREAARLQFIPDFFAFGENVGVAALAEMIGNAVPPKLTYVLALELLR